MDTRNPGPKEADDSARRIASLSPAKLAALAQQLKERKARVERMPFIPRRGESENSAPLLPSQVGIWLMDHLHPNLPLYTMAGAWPFKGMVNLNALEQAMFETVRRHEILRTSFPAPRGEPVQLIAPADLPRLPIVDLCGLPEQERWKQAERLTLLDRLLRFDLSKEGPLRMTFLLLGKDEMVLLHSVHHIAFDAWSSSVFTTEREALYRDYSAGKPSSLAELPIQCADFALWHQQWMQGEDAQAQLSYWKEQLGGSSPELELPADRPRAGSQFRGAWQKTLLSSTTTEALKTITHKEGATMFMTLLATFNGLLSRYTGQRDINVGSIFTTRNRSEIEGLIGPFFNTLVLRTDLSGNPTFRELVRRVRQTTLDAYKYSDYPFADLAEALRSSRDPEASSMFRAKFGMGAPQKNSNAGKLFDLAMEGLNHLMAMNMDTQSSRSADTIKSITGEAWLPDNLGIKLDYDLAFYVHEYGDQLDVRIWFNSNLFDRVTIARMLSDFRVFADAVAADPDRQISAAPLMGETGLHQLIEEWNDTRSSYENGKTFSDLFEARVEQMPDAVAVVSEDEQVSYQELRQRSTLLARSLRKLGVGQEGLVAVVAGRGIDFLTVMLAAFKVGAAYLPLDPFDPAARIHQVLSRSKTDVILTTEEFMPEVMRGVDSMASEELPEILTIEMLLGREQPGADLRGGPLLSNRAYVMHTSGSTGTPKGVMVEQAGMVNHLLAKISDLQLTAADTVVQNASEKFDISVWQFLAALLVGGRVCIIDDEAAHSPLELLRLVEREAVTILEIVPSLMVAMLEEMTMGDTRPDLSSLRWLLVTGEEVSADSCTQWLSFYPGLPLLNAYGPTECSDDVTHYAIHEPPSMDVVHMPVGRPVRNTRIHVLDKMNLPAPIGVSGELYVGGVGVGRGYLHDPEKTAEVFVPDPFYPEQGSRLYKTGDLARYRPDGNIEYLGRLDQQVKVRGFRIELAEIEIMLGRCPGVQQAVVLAREDDPGDKRLVAYVVASQDPPPTGRDLIDFSRNVLPDYMAPSAFVFLDEMPLTSNGKIDRRALPPPDEYRLPDDEEWVAPDGPIEKKVAEIWLEMFKVNRIGIYDNFFHLGGHSIKAVRVINRINQAFNVNLSVRSLFEEPTVAGLALLVEEALIEKLEAD